MMNLFDPGAAPLFSIGGLAITAAHLLLAAGLVLLVLLFGLLQGVRRGRRQAEALARQQAEMAEDRLDAVLAAQAELQGRMAAMSEMFGARQAEFNQAINQRLDGMGQRIGASLSEQTKATHENLTRLQERLAVIDTAQNNIQTLARDVVGLQAILSNKQTRGAFGQSRMETIIQDGLPFGSYEFQPTLSNGKRPDCTIIMPNEAPPLVIDAKFPLEAWNSMREGKESEGASGDGAAAAKQRFRQDMDVHIRDIAEKYLLSGETQDTAFLFVPSESIFAEIHENFEAIVQRAHRARVVIVSPSLLMLSVQVVQALLKDARMREQAHLIQGEVARLMDDLGRLDTRVQKLQTHFGQTQGDIDQILISTAKLSKRGAKIGELDFQPGPATAAAPADAISTKRPKEPQAEAADLAEGAQAGPGNESGRLRLRVVDEDQT
ncbi:DNA recombination protein RmuC [Pseudohoeflea coraliihabitans]|uniref:DNA recombination protein RmuC homolog n=1 Tax=Pseudohoeflea coraliihabitans TaxID=2860393 RepID=A0ABS6WNP1_9HYPH|nr:DNA recombination protein RmuC [Pseudohoeflea sp. DP4N28-3]MBW3097584.1 DNA recombination protein RmuC [Pseudohoeflea sp. DP4N28-3]